jgi:hypothetical protein
MQVARLLRRLLISPSFPSNFNARDIGRNRHLVLVTGGRVGDFGDGSAHCHALATQEVVQLRQDPSRC